MYEAIEKGKYPKWSVEFQTMTPKEAEELWEKQKINVFDLTHVWPQKQFPLRKVGEFVLNENAINYFAEIEQAAFNPSHIPPGIEPSADPVLQSRPGLAIVRMAVRVRPNRSVPNWGSQLAVPVPVPCGGG